MALGEIPGGNLRAYYKLENLNDLSGNGFTLTNNNSVAFNQGKFTNGADFGSSGTNKGLTYESNVFSALKVNNLQVMFWFKLNSTANTSRDMVLFNFNTSSGTDGMNTLIVYTISGGNINIRAQRLATPSNHNIILSFPVNSNWNFLNYRKLNSGSSQIQQVLRVNRKEFINEHQSSGDVSSTANPTVKLSIGNNRSLTGQAFCQIDELVIDEGLYISGSDGGQSANFKYFTQAKGRFCI
jgi:hypothetical protein